MNSSKMTESKLLKVFYSCIVGSISIWTAIMLFENCLLPGGVIAVIVATYYLFQVQLVNQMQYESGYGLTFKRKAFAILMFVCIFFTLVQGTRINLYFLIILEIIVGNMFLYDNIQMETTNDKAVLDMVINCIIFPFTDFICYLKTWKNAKNNKIIRFTYTLFGTIFFFSFLILFCAIILSKADFIFAEFMNKVYIVILQVGIDIFSILIFGFLLAGFQFSFIISTVRYEKKTEQKVKEHVLYFTEKQLLIVITLIWILNFTFAVFQFSYLFDMRQYESVRTARKYSVTYEEYAISGIFFLIMALAINLIVCSCIYIFVNKKDCIKLRICGVGFIIVNFVIAGAALYKVWYSMKCGAEDNMVYIGGIIVFLCVLLMILSFSYTIKPAAVFYNFLLAVLIGMIALAGIPFRDLTNISGVIFSFLDKARIIS